jgi:ribosomal protein S18 acetylase RimI-like enzyme
MIVQVTEEHWEELKIIRLASLKDSPEAFAVRFETASNYSEADWRKRSSGKEGATFFIKKLENQPVGIISGIQRDDDYELVSLWVSPEQRSNGIAKCLIEKIIEHAKIIGKVSIFLEVSKTNFSARTLYKKTGFTTYRETESNYVMRANFTR